jgi:hypothetical protein
MKKRLLGLGMIACLLMTACGSGMKVEMDNPTDQSITVSIDGKEYTLAPMELLPIKGLKKGEHTLQMAGGQETKFTLETPSLLNPTLSLYVTDKEEYSGDGTGMMDDSDWVTVLIDSTEYWGPIEVFENQLVIPLNKINYGVTTDFPEEVETSREAVIHTKIFRKNDFLKYYEEAYQ